MSRQIEHGQPAQEASPPIGFRRPTWQQYRQFMVYGVVTNAAIYFGTAAIMGLVNLVNHLTFRELLSQDQLLAGGASLLALAFWLELSLVFGSSRPSRPIFLFVEYVGLAVVAVILPLVTLAFDMTGYLLRVLTSIVTFGGFSCWVRVIAPAVPISTVLVYWAAATIWFLAVMIAIDAFTSYSLF